ncbi:MAG: TA system VapC family ribonuclease toxin [Deltaproteobacteria bacterium]
MIVPDVNLLLYAYVDAYPEHPAAKAWWTELVRSGNEVGLPLPVVYGFVRIATNRRVYVKPMSIETALQRVESWLAEPAVHVVLPGPRHLEIAFALLRGTGAAVDLTTDVQIAALAIENQGEVHSNDTDFARFPGLRFFNPLHPRRSK